MGREAGWRLAVVAFFYMTALAWLCAVAVYQIGSRL
jgi:Fe2+ transport system protein B